MSKSHVFVEVNEDGNIIRIIRHGVYDLPIERVRQVARSVAVKEIRDEVFKRSKGYCRDCGDIIDYTFHMHEVVFRGQGGEISLENSIALCSKCHRLIEHKARRLRFGES